MTPTGIAKMPNTRNPAPNHGPTVATPAVAPTDSQNPTERTSSGSTSSNATTARHRMRAGARSRPNTNAVADNAAIAPARTIDGSNRVKLTNHAINPNVTIHRLNGRSTRSNGPAAANTNATFCPDTAVRCDRPLARKRWIISIG